MLLWWHHHHSPSFTNLQGIFTKAENRSHSIESQVFHKEHDLTAPKSGTVEKTWWLSFPAKWKTKWPAIVEHVPFPGWLKERSMNQWTSKIWWDLTVELLHFMSPRHGYCQEEWYTSRIILSFNTYHPNLEFAAQIPNAVQIPGVSHDPHDLQQKKEKKNEILGISKDWAIDVSSVLKEKASIPLLLLNSISRKCWPGWDTESATTLKEFSRLVRLCRAWDTLTGFSCSEVSTEPPPGTQTNHVHFSHVA